MPGLDTPRGPAPEFVKRAREELGLEEKIKKIIEPKLNPIEKIVYEKYVNEMHYHLVAWGKGYPDFTFRKGHKFYFIEVKTDYDKLTDTQRKVLRALREAGQKGARCEVGVERYSKKTRELRRCDYEI